ncbi:MAG: FkbM family methyltransferase [Candidatus Woesebacteria bacterium]|nr:MAG: FkbM family methyltransferase [Candidatus Woesebacteria bacterium]
MKNIFKKLRIYGLKRFSLFLLGEMKYLVWFQKIKNSYSQLQEDILIDKILGFKKKGFYVDVGANDPIRFSNTFRFYKKGWRGITIEPDTLSFEKLQKTRPKDLNLNLGVGTKKKTTYFYKFFPDTLSTTSKKSSDKYEKQGFKMLGVEKIKIEKLSTLLKKFCKRNIDLMSVDTEGYDLEVLKSNNWKKFRPKILCIEVSQIKENKIKNYLAKVGYRQYLNNGLNSIFIEKNYHKTL